MPYYTLKFKTHTEQYTNKVYLLFLIFFSTLFGIYCFPYLWLLLSFVIIVTWSKLYSILYTVLLRKKVSYHIPYLITKNNANETEEKILFTPLPHIENTKEALQRYLKKDKLPTSATIYPTFTSKNGLSSSILSDIYALLGYKLLFSSVQSIYAFFILSFFILNFIYSLIIFSIMQFVDLYSFAFHVEILSLIVMFATMLYIYINTLQLKKIQTSIQILSPQQESLDHDFLIFLFENNTLTQYTLSSIFKDIQSIQENLDKITLTLLQVAIPIFFLAYINIIMNHNF